MHLIQAGVDEAGRGPLAGPVVAAAVIFDVKYDLSLFKDSKVLTSKMRDVLYEQITKDALTFGIGICNVFEIDTLNIHYATLLAMERAVLNLSIKPDLVLIDGKFVPKNLPYAMQAIVSGDNLVPLISAASILAKVTRDRIMIDLHDLYPKYNFAQHKGYATKEHYAAIKKHGTIKEHRKNFVTT